MNAKLEDSIDLLQLAYKAFKRDPDNKLHRAALAKAFEVSFEYLWKYFKQVGSREGFEIYSPRDAIKSALSMKLISDPQRWETYLSHRNLSVHDYIGLDSEETPIVVRDFLKDVGRLAFK